MRRPSPRPPARACALLLSGVLAAGLVLVPVVPVRADGVGDRQAQVEAALTAATADLDDADAATRAAAAQLTSVEGRLASARTALAGARAELAAAQQAQRAADAAATAAAATLASARAARAGAAARVAAQQRSTASYAVAAYETGATPDALAVVAAARDPRAFVERLGLLDQVAAGQRRVLVAYQVVTTQLQQAEQVVAQRTQALVARQQAARAAVARVAAVTAEATATAAQLTSLQAQRAGVLARAETVLAAQRSRVAQLTVESNRIAALLRARASTGTPRIGRGGLLWPADGPETSPFGYRVDPVTHQYALHAGVDIGAPEGAPIHAATAGTVVFAGQETGYGDYTCIDRGGGFSTCYAHQSQELVHVGEVVARGQVIGSVGATGYATGPHLHVETRIDGNPVDPMQYF